MIQIHTNIPRHDVKKMADDYNETTDQFSFLSIKELESFHKLINRQFSDISKVIHFDFVDYEPYGESPEIKNMLRDFRRGVVRIHTTGNDSKVWGTFYNLQFRAIHDFIHLVHELDFKHSDEIIAYKKQMEFSLQQKYTDAFPHLNWDAYNRVLRSEIVYQSAYKEAYGKFHIDQKIILSDL